MNSKSVFVFFNVRVLWMFGILQAWQCQTFVSVISSYVWLPRVMLLFLQSDQENSHLQSLTFFKTPFLKMYVWLFLNIDLKLLQ